MEKKLVKIAKEIGFNMNNVENILRFVKRLKEINWKELPSNLHKKFRNLIAMFIYERNWYWLEYLISLLATIEMELPLVFDKDFRRECNTSDTVCVNPPQEEKGSLASRVIPKDIFYCEGCYFEGRSEIARFFYGYQCCGYCYYLGKGDFSFLRPTELLWDGCKECNKFEFEGEVEE